LIFQHKVASVKRTPLALDKARLVLKNQHMAKPKLTDSLSRRERQVMNILFQRGEATVSEVIADLPDPPTYSAVRSILRILTEKKLITHKEEALRLSARGQRGPRRGRGAQSGSPHVLRRISGRRSDGAPSPVGY
jgi:hypothetical protein